MPATAAKRATNLTLPAALLDEARALGVNLSKACAEGLTAEVKRARSARWLEENAAALAASDAWVERNGLPLEHLRLF